MNSSAMTSEPTPDGAAELHPSQKVSLDAPSADIDHRPPPIKHVSAPTYQSPLRHHYKQRSGPRIHVKETLNARSEYSNSGDDGTAEHRINQYLIGQEIGRGSFGSVHLGVDQFGKEYAIKEFSKARLRKRAQSNLLRRPNAGRIRGHFTAGRGFNMPLSRQTTPTPGATNALDLIREEIAIMKKLHHPNIVSLIEVLDDPTEDSLYMVLDMCKKGVVMRVGLDEKADAYNPEKCRHLFRDMVLGLEYLHAQGVLHRDIKPDNCLITEDNVLKFVDFGVSEMFSKDSEMTTTKSAGSPAFMPPELCVAKHGEISGKAADIWSMGVTLYCLKFGHIPFEKTGMLELYDSIKNDPLRLDEECEPDLRDLLSRLLEKDPQKRIEMDGIREHSWVTRRGTDKLLPKEENISNLIEPPTEEELDSAITAPIRHLFTVMKAAKQFKRLLARRRPELSEGFFGRASKIVAPPLPMQKSLKRSQSDSADDRQTVEAHLVSEGIHRNIEVSESLKRVPEDIDAAYNRERSHANSHPPRPSTWEQREKMNQFTTPINEETEPVSPEVDKGKGHAHDPLEDTLFLNIGSGSDTAVPEPDGQPAVSESPGAVDVNVYEKAYEDEIQKILTARETKPTLYLNRRVEGAKHLREHEHIIDFHRHTGGAPKLGFSKLVEKAKSHVEAHRKAEAESSQDGEGME